MGVGSTFGQCPLSNVFLRTQSQVDEFIINYPNCDKIGGTLYIGNNWNDIQDIVDLSPLSQIDTIVGGLRVFDNEYLTTLSDLSLEHVSYINIHSNHVLTNLEGLEDVTTVSGYVEIYDNGSLVDLEGLNGLTSVEDYVQLEANGVLSNVDALENLTTIGSYLQIKSHGNLATIDGLGNLVSVGGYLDLTSNGIDGVLGLNSLVSVGDYVYMQWNGFNSLEGLSNLTSIGGDLEIIACWSLSDFVGLEGITSVDELKITGCGVLNFEGLNNINSVEDLHIEGNPNVTNIDALSSLNFIDGRIIIRENEALTNLNGLTNIDSIAGSVNIYENCSLTDVSGINNVGINSSLDINKNCILTNLDGMDNVYIGGGLEIFDNNQLTSISGLDITQDTIGFLKIWSNDNLPNLSGLQNLRAVVNNFHISNHDNLISLFGLRNVTSVGDMYMSQNHKLVDLNGLDSIQVVTSDLEIKAHDDLQQIDALANVTSVGRNLIIRSNDLLQNIDGLQSITSIEGHLRIEENNQLKNLEGLSSVTSVGDYIKIIDNDDITTLNGLQNISSATDYITIQDNYELTTIQALLNLDMSNINNLTITTNVGLSFCSTPNLCEYLIEGGEASISSNGLGEDGCANVDQILDNCSNLPKIYTQVFYDANQNKIQDANEQNYSGASVIVEPGNFTIFPNIDDGKFSLLPNNYTITFNQSSVPDWQLTTDATSYDINAMEGQTYTLPFGLFPENETSKIQTYITSLPARCNETITMNVTTKNLGTTIASGTIWLTIDDNVSGFNFIDEPDTTVIDFDAYGWYFTDLYPGYSLTKQVEVTIPGPPDFTLGERMLFVTYTNFVDANGSDSSEGFRYNPEVLCSYDPNDKLVNPNREGNYTLFEEDLIYTIRFQNTGNDVAYDVVILDTLDTNLDKSTFRLLGSSHTDVLNTSMSENGIITFEFKDIFLPDSTSNLEGSQGHVTYLISTIDGLAENTPVTNSAGIYFDLNPPIITNTTENIMVTELPTVSTILPDNLSDIVIFPNPNTGTFEIQGITSQSRYKIYNTLGQIIQTGNLTDGTLINISAESSGIYFLHIDNGKQVATMKLVKE